MLYEVITIDVSPSNPNVLYALLDNYEIAYKAKKGELDSYNRQKQDVIKGATVYKSTDAGKTWKQTSGLTPRITSYNVCYTKLLRPRAPKTAGRPGKAGKVMLFWW